MRGTGKRLPATPVRLSKRFVVAAAVLAAFSLILLAFSSPALALPFHARAKSLDVTGLNHACGVAVDNKGDLYASSAGESKVNVYDPSHVLLTSISDAHEPCGLAVTTTGNLYVSEKATGEVVRYKPNAYPFSGTPSYGSREVIDASGKAKGISVDRFDDRLYVAEGDHVAVYKADGSFEANVGEGALTEASGVAAYTHIYKLSGIEKTYRYLWAADANGLLPDRLELFAGQTVGALKSRRELTGSTTPDGSFGFGAKGAYLAADPGNRNSEGKCLLLGEPQACTEGHLLLYDAAHKALDEFDATGEYLDQIRNAAFADAEPTAVAIDRSGAANDGALYVSAGAGSGAKALAFGPLKAPSRKVLKKPSEEAGGLSQELAAVTSVAVGPDGYVYASQASLIHVYKPNGIEVKTEGGKVLLEDKFEAKGAKPFDLAVDSTCKVYVLDERGGFQGEELVTYYTPSKCPPDSSTTYTRHEPAVAIPSKFTDKDNLIQSIAINPGPSSAKDHLFVTTRPETQEYDSAANGSGLLNEKFAAGLNLGNRLSLAVNGANGNVWFGANFGGVGPAISAVDSTGKELLSQFENTGAANGKTGFNPSVAIDQSNGHVITFDGSTSSAREYDAAGSFVAQFGSFTEGLVKPYDVAVDNACAIKGLTGKACEEFDPANRTAFVAFDDTSASHPPYDINAFGLLTYPEPVKHKLTVERKGTGSGTVTSSPAGINCGATCTAEYLETEVVTLTAKAGVGSKFVKWEGCEAETVSPSEGTCEVTMSEDQEVTVAAEFEKISGKEFPLEVIVEGPGSVTSEPSGIECPATCSAEFVELAIVTLTAEPDPSSEFISWEGCDAEPSSIECEVTMTENKVIKAKFGPEHPLLTVVKEGTGSGKVTSEDGFIHCSPTCTHKYNLGDEVTLTAKPEGASEFKGWTGCDSEPSETECEVTMGEPRQVTATFAALPQATVTQPHPITYTEATLHGEVQTAELETEYRFDYLTQAQFEEEDESFEHAQHTPEVVLGAAKAAVAVQAHLSGLEEGTAYRFRLIAANTAGMVEDEGSFETLERRAAESCLENAEYRTGFSAHLPDCRAYELVTPAQTNGLSPYAANEGNSPSRPFNNWLTVQSGAAAGERLTYFTDGTLPGFEGNGLLDGYQAERGAGDHPSDGWQSTLFSPNYREAAGNPANQLGVASDQLYSIFEVTSNSVTFPDTLPQGIYLRTPTGFEALGDPEARSKYASAGGTHAIFASTAHLEPDAPPAGNVALYDRAAGSASTHVLTLPPGNASEEEEAEFLDALRSKEQAAYQGASEDGATVVFKAGVGLYVRLDDTSAERISPRIAQVGNTLSCAAGPLLGLAPGDQRKFQWLRDAMPIPGASGLDNGSLTDYTTVPADKGAALQCLTVATFLDPRSVAVSAPVWVAPLEAGQAPQPPAQIAAPTPVNPVVGTIETCNAGSWEGATSFAYQWYVDGEAIPGATSQTYEVQAADAPGTLQCLVKGSNAAATVARASDLTPTSPAPAEAAPVATAQAFPKTTYAGVSEDGRYVFFALGEGNSPGRLFRFDTQSEEATEIAAAGIFTLVSPDGSHTFFSSEEVLTGDEENENCEEVEEELTCEEAEPGARNLYVWDGTTTRFVGRLATADFEGFGGNPEMNLAAWTRALALTHETFVGRALAPTRSTQSGGTFVFQSHARLTAYDNEGVGEIYRYDPSAPEGERLLCVSCDPTGAPPSADALLEDIRGSVQYQTMIANVSDDGQKVFFQSLDRLLPEDVNDAEDVYEWEVEGTGGCARPAGCLSLISTGQGETPSFLYAMSADGRDVFIQTKEKLVGSDLPGSPSIYDARAGGGIPEPAEPAPCQGDACQGQGSEPPVLPSPMTGGPGEEPQVEVRKPCAKGRHRVKGRCVPVKHRHRKHHRGARAKSGGSR